MQGCDSNLFLRKGNKGGRSDWDQFPENKARLRLWLHMKAFAKAKRTVLLRMKCKSETTRLRLCLRAEHAFVELPAYREQRTESQHNAPYTDESEANRYKTRRTLKIFKMMQLDGVLTDCCKVNIEKVAEHLPLNTQSMIFKSFTFRTLLSSNIHTCSFASTLKYFLYIPQGQLHHSQTTSNLQASSYYTHITCPR